MRKALTLLGGLEDSDIRWMATQGTVRRAEAGATLIQEGVDTASVMILLDGELSVTLGTGRQIATLYAGDVLGELAFVDSRPPTATVRAARKSQVLEISKAELNSRLSSDIAFAARFYRAIAGFLAHRLRSSVSQLGYGDAARSTDPDELDESTMHALTLAAGRFDRLLRAVESY